jgi:hypothetical protein
MYLDLHKANGNTQSWSYSQGRRRNYMLAGDICINRYDQFFRHKQFDQRIVELRAFTLLRVNSDAVKVTVIVWTKARLTEKSFYMKNMTTSICLLSCSNDTIDTDQK